MKFKKAILLLSIFISSSNIYNSYAKVDNNDFPERYKTLDGEQIVITEETEGELVEIEVFGNTIQNPNNLEDIQSVGDLYVDNNGNPILDSLGGEQYSINIIASNNKLKVSNSILNSNTDDVDVLKILIPCQLEKAGDIKDRLYYDKSQGNWFIEKNIKTTVLNGVELWSFHSILVENDDNVYFVSTNRPEKSASLSRYKINLISTSLPAVSRDYFEENIMSEGVSLHSNSNQDTNWYTVSINKNKLDRLTISEFKKWLSNNNIIIKRPSDNPFFIRVNNANKIDNIFLNENTTIYLNTRNSINSTLNIKIDIIDKLIKEAIELAKENPTIDNISRARMLINMTDDSMKKDSFNNELSEISKVEDLKIELKKTTANTDVYIKSKNALSMSLSTNSITFEDFGGTEDIEKLNSVIITVDSSLPYSFNSYLLSEIRSKDGVNVIPKELFNIKLNGETQYKVFTNISEPPTTKVVGFLGLRPKIFFLIHRKLPKNAEEFRSYIYSNNKAELCCA